MGAGDGEVGLRGGKSVKWVGERGEGDGFLAMSEILASRMLDF